MAAIGVFAALLAVLLVIRRAYNRACLEKVDVELSISAATATEGDELTLTEVVTNSKWLPLPWLAVKFQVDRELEFADMSAAVVSDLYYRNDLFHILMHQKITRRLNFTCARRGYYAIRGLEVTGWDILMEKKYIRRFETSTRLTVYPRMLEMREAAALCTRIYGQMRAKFPIHPDPFSFRGIREYSPHDPVKNINFKASAKVNELMVNVREFSNARQVVLILDAERHPVWHNENHEERAIKIAATLAERMEAQNVPVAFVTNGKSVRSGAAAQIPEGRGAVHLRAILEALAYVNFAAKDPAPITETLEKIALSAEFEPEFLLISPYHCKATEAAYSRLQNAGARAAWIMPGEKPKDMNYGDGIIFV